MTRAALYCRVSTDDQAEHGISLADQESRLTSYCAAMNHEANLVFVDSGVSGSTDPMERPAFSDLVSEIATLSKTATPITHIIAVDLSRFSRDTKHTLDLVAFCERNNVALVSLAESLDTKTPSGRMVVTVLAAMNQFQRENIAAKTKSALAHLKASGRVYGNVPYGFKPDAFGRLVVDEGEQKVLTFAKSAFAVDPFFGYRASVRVVLESARDIGLINPRTGRVVNAGCLRRLRDAIISEEESS